MKDYIYSDGEFSLVRWADRCWALVPPDDTDAGQTDFMLLDAEQRDLPVVLEKLMQEQGEPFVTGVTLPHNLPPTRLNRTVFFLPVHNYAVEGEAVYWWRKDSLIIRLFTSDADDAAGVPAAAYLSIFNTALIPE